MRASPLPEQYFFKEKIKQNRNVFLFLKRKNMLFKPDPASRSQAQQKYLED
jgi:hypothetical protein